MSIYHQCLVSILLTFLCPFIWGRGMANTYVKNEFLLKLKKEMTVSMKKKLASQGVILDRVVKLSFGNFYIVKSKNKAEKLGKTLRQLESIKGIDYAEPNFIYSVNPIRSKLKVNIKKLISTPKDPMFKELWGLENKENDGVDIDALKAWKKTKGNRKIKIAVIDTGVDYNHPDLKDNMWVNLAEQKGKPGVDDDNNGYIDDIHGHNFVDNTGDPMDDNGHGTHCAGTIGALHNNAIGVAGVMDDVSLIAIKFLDDNGSGTLESVIQSIDYATQAGVDLMSNSWGGGAYSQALKDAIQRASDKGIIFIAAAGNDGTDNDSEEQYPANYDVENIISVASHNKDDKLSSFSCFGRKSVHIIAPGEDVLSTYPDNKYEVLSGTSMATPHVSGVIGLLLARDGRMDHGLLKERLMATSVPRNTYRSKSITGGRLNAYNFLINKRPLRIRPDEKKWKTIALDTPWESEHPYASHTNIEKAFEVPGAKYMRLKVARIDVESRYDYLEIIGSKGDVIETISGKREENYRTDYIEGDQLLARFKSDLSIEGWGFIVKEVQWQ